MESYLKYGAIALFVILRVVYAILVGKALAGEDRKLRNLGVFLSITFPIIAGIVCVTKNKSKVYLILIAVLIYVVLYSPSFIQQKPSTPTSPGFTTIIESPLPEGDEALWYDLDGTAHKSAYDKVYYDREGNSYEIDFEIGVDYLCKNHTDERYNIDQCYYDSEGYFYYDDDYSIVLRDEHSCIDTDGAIYYPNNSRLNYDGKIIYTAYNAKYDRNATGYTHDHIPFFDAQGNKYYYSYDADAVKGTYTNIETGEGFDWKISYIDRDGYIVFDMDNKFVEDNDEDTNKTFVDPDGNVYYWAPTVSWNENGQLLDHMGEIIE